MIADAVDTAITLGWALLAWIVLMAVVAGVAVYAVVVTVAVVCRTAWRGVTAAVAAVQRSSAPELPSEAHKPSHAHTGPSWARTDKEAA